MNCLCGMELTITDAHTEIILPQDPGRGYTDYERFTMFGECPHCHKKWQWIRTFEFRAMNETDRKEVLDE